MNDLNEISRYKDLISKNIIFTETSPYYQTEPFRYELVQHYEIEHNDYYEIKRLINSATSSSNISLLEYFLADHHQSDLARKYFMSEAMKYDHEDIFKYLQKKSEIRNDYSLFKYSIFLKSIKYVEYLVEDVENINFIELRGTDFSVCPLSIALKATEYSISEKSLDIIELLLRKGADLNIDLYAKQFPRGIQMLLDSPNYVASTEKVIPYLIKHVNNSCHCDLINLFLKYGYNINIFDLSNFLKKNYYQFFVLDIFIRHGYNFTNFFDDYEFGFKKNEVSEQIEDFLENAPFETIEYILRNSKFLGKHDIKLLYYFAMANRTDVVELLVALGANVSGLKPESIAKIFYSGAPKYRSCTSLLSDNESLLEAWYSGNIYDRGYWDLNDERRSDENNLRLKFLAESLLNSISDRLVYYLTCHGAPIDWCKYFVEVLKTQILWEKYILEGKESERSDSLRQLSRDGWNAAFEISSWEGDFHDYL